MKKTRGRPRKGIAKNKQGKARQEALWDLLRKYEKCLTRKDAAAVRKGLLSFRETHGVEALTVVRGMLRDLEWRAGLMLLLRREDSVSGDTDAANLTTQGPTLHDRAQCRALCRAEPWYELRHAYRHPTVFTDEMLEMYHVPICVHLDQKPSVRNAQVDTIVKRWRAIRDGKPDPYPARNETPPIIPPRHDSFAGKRFRVRDTDPAARNKRKPRTKRLDADRLERFAGYLDGLREDGNLRFKRDPEKVTQNASATQAGTEADLMRSTLDRMEDMPEEHRAVFMEHTSDFFDALKDAVHECTHERSGRAVRTHHVESESNSGTGLFSK